MVLPVRGYGMIGLYPTNISENMRLVCVRGRTKALIKKVNLQKGAPPTLLAWDKKRNVEVTIYNKWHQTFVIFPDDNNVGMAWLKPGTRIDIGIPVRKRKPAGMRMIGKAMKEALALPPEPKPEDEPAEQPGEPAPAEQPGEPAPQPQPGPAPREPAA